MMVKFKGNPDGKFFIAVQGESHYQKNIRDVILYKHMVEKEDLEHSDKKLIATLVFEDENKFDPGNAVRVDIEGKTVGYLERQDAKQYRRSLAKLNLTDVVGECRAAAFGKRESEGKVMKFGIWLSLDIKDLQVEEKPPPRPGLFDWLFKKKE